MSVRRLVGIFVTVALAACAGLPARQPPRTWAAALPLSDFPGTGAARADWPAAAWWTRYGDAHLDRLIDMALADSPTLKAAHARLDTARQSVRLAGSSSGAHVAVAGDAARQRLSDNGLFPPNLLGFHWYDQYDLGLQASYTFDWWGKQQDAVEAAIDEAHAAQADRAAAALMLASSVADTYFGWQADQNRLLLAREQEATVMREGRITAARIRAELAAGDETQRADSSLAAVRERIAALDGSARLRVVALAALVGRAAAELPALETRSLPPVSDGVPTTVGIDLMARRADLAASRWRVEAADQNLAAARAEFLPDISINALVGLQSRDFTKLFQYGSRVPEFGTAVHLPIFDAGRLRAQYGASQAAIDAAVAGYEETLVNAARDVATQATTRAQIAAQRTQRVIELNAAERLRSSAAARARQGLTDARLELAATEAWLDERDALLQLDAAALSADIGLQRALGGGYERNEPRP